MNVQFLDGALGTELQKRGLKPGEAPERMNVTSPEMVASVHRAYLKAGSDVILTNTFGANRKKIGSSEEAVALIRAGIRLAKEVAGTKKVALDIGPIGELLEPMGSLSFEEAYEIYREMVEAGEEADLILFETMTDLLELKAGLLAAREHSDKPVFCSMTFGENGRTFTGVSVEAFALTASPLADALGLNCSLGPDALYPLMERLASFTEKPLFIKANAGLPDENSHYNVGAMQFCRAYEAFYRLGVAYMGGCCGTTPEYIKLLKGHYDLPVLSRRKCKSAVCSAATVAELNRVCVVGERINPTGKKKMKEALIAGDMNFVTNQALEQIEAGADILDVNCGLPELNEAEVLPKLIRFLQSITDTPLQIDSSDPKAVEAALRVYNGRALVNSVNGSEESLSSILPLVKKYGAAVVGLCVDDKGVPQSREARIGIAERIFARAAALGIPERDICIDCLTLTVSAQQEQAMETLAAIRYLKERHPEAHFTLGVSNVSFGLPARPIVNAAFLTLAMHVGLDLPILNPNIPEMMQAVAAFRVLSGEDKGCVNFIERYASYRGVLSAKPVEVNAAPEAGIAYHIRHGLDSAREECAKLLETHAPLEVINDYLIPALNDVGEAYEKGVLFLPQLIAASESAKLCFAEVKARIPAGAVSDKIIVIATVKGDVHDIGKNIVKTVLENYGYRMIDLGKNVDPDLVARTCFEQKAKLCGLSALMTTTVPAMAETIVKVKELCPDCRIMVGGAVLTPDYAAKIGADYYSKDAAASVRIAEEVFGT